MRRTRSAALTSFILVLLSGCAQELGVELDFPNVATFGRSSTVNVMVIPLAEGEERQCASLAQEAEFAIGTLPDTVEETGAREVCEFSQFGINLKAVPSGLAAFVAVARDESSDVLLTGCTVRDLGTEESPGDEDVLQISLFPTEAYDTKFEGMTYPASCDVERRCTGGGATCR